MRKYYYDESPFLYDDMGKWEFIIPYIQTYGDYLEVVEDVIDSSDIASRLKIQKLLLDEVSYFESAKPIDRTVSLSPFIVKNNYISVCIKYKICDELINELKANWLNELKETSVMPAFIVFSNNIPIFWVHTDGAVILLEEGEKTACQNAGCKLEEWNVSLNESLYGIKASTKLQ